MSIKNAGCKCPNLKCPNHGNCRDCSRFHHKGLHTYCKAGKLKKTIHKLHAKITN